MIGLLNYVSTIDIDNNNKSTKKKIILSFNRKNYITNIDIDELRSYLIINIYKKKIMVFLYLLSVLILGIGGISKVTYFFNRLQTDGFNNYENKILRKW